MFIVLSSCPVSTPASAAATATATTATAATATAAAMYGPAAATAAAYATAGAATATTHRLPAAIGIHLGNPAAIDVAQAGRLPRPVVSPGRRPRFAGRPADIRLTGARSVDVGTVSLADVRAVPLADVRAIALTDVGTVSLADVRAIPLANVWTVSLSADVRPVDAAAPAGRPVLQPLKRAFADIVHIGAPATGRAFVPDVRSPVTDVVAAIRLEVVLDVRAVEIGELVPVDVDLRSVDILPVDIVEIGPAVEIPVVEAIVAVDIDVAAVPAAAPHAPIVPVDSRGPQDAGYGSGEKGRCRVVVVRIR